MTRQSPSLPRSAWEHPRRRSASFWLIPALAIAASAIGCNPEKVPRLGRVTGAVTLDGQPVPNATILFSGAKEGEPPSMGRTDAAGNYELYYSRGHKGATRGEHTVIISTFQAEDDDNPKGIRETIPAKYNAKSELKATVKGGQNKLDFALQAGGEIIQPDAPDPKQKKGKKGK
jgi:hypothetical protein